MDPTDSLFLLARIFLSSVFIYSGLEKLLYWREGVDELKGFRLPFPTVALVVTVAVQLGAGTMVLLGLHARLGALILFGFTCAATLMAHRFWAMRGIAFRKSLTTALEHLAIMGGFLLIAALGPGRFALSSLWPIVAHS
jgi:putative oxidoreductase